MPANTGEVTSAAVSAVPATSVDQPVLAKDVPSKPSTRRTAPGVLVAVGVAVEVEVAVGVKVGGDEGVGVKVLVAVAVGVAVRVGVSVAVGVTVGVGVSVGMGVSVGVGVIVGVGDAVGVSVAVGVIVGVGLSVGTLVCVLVGVGVLVTVGVLVGVAVGGLAPPAGALVNCIWSKVSVPELAPQARGPKPSRTATGISASEPLLLSVTDETVSPPICQVSIGFGPRRSSDKLSPYHCPCAYGTRVSTKCVAPSFETYCAQNVDGLRSNSARTPHGWGPCVSNERILLKY